MITTKIKIKNKLINLTKLKNMYMQYYSLNENAGVDIPLFIDSFVCQI